MNGAQNPRRPGIKTALISGLILLLLLAFIGFEYKGAGPDLKDLVSRTAKKEELLSRMRINLIKSAAIEKDAVMADTDEMSRELASQSMKVSDAVEQDRVELSRLILPAGEDREMKLFDDFSSCWAELRKIDEKLLQFAVENTNIKASTLSFTSGGKAIEQFEQSLTGIIKGSAGNARAVGLACDALTAGLRAYTLHAPHIAASNDAEMERIEAEIKQSDRVVKESLGQLEGVLPGEAGNSLRRALAAYADFESITAQVISLSRRNTNVKSFELSLGRKRKVTIQCDEFLAGMQELVQSKTFEATR